MMEEIELLLTKTLGLNVASVGSSLVIRSVQQRMTTRGIGTMQEYLTLLQHPDRRELHELIERIVISETWFFRNHEALNTLVRLMTTEWQVMQRGHVRRILSIPCATGEEPYSIAIALAEANLSHSEVKIDAIDVSRHALARAERAVYGRNSFRGDASRICQKYSRPVTGGVELIPEIRQWVRFSHGNLVSNFRPPETAYDVIFCRNLLIYLDRPSQERALTTLHGLLTPSGYLFLGPAEATLAAEFGFQTTEHEMAFVCQKSPQGPSRTERPRIVTRLAPSSKRPEQPVIKAPRVPSISRGVPPVTRRTPIRPLKIVTDDAPADASQTDLDTIRRLADAGRVTEAMDRCEAHTKAHGPTADVLYLLGILYDTKGATELATKSYRKALFLDPNHEDASAQLAIHAQRTGDTAGAERLRARIQRIQGRKS